MKILALEKLMPNSTGGAFEPFLAEEASRVWVLQQEGVIREIYFRADRDEAVLMLEAGGLDEARRILSTLPLVRENLITFDVIPLVPYSGFERLFRSSVTESGQACAVLPSAVRPGLRLGDRSPLPGPLVRMDPGRDRFRPRGSGPTCSCPDTAAGEQASAGSLPASL